MKRIATAILTLLAASATMAQGNAGVGIADDENSRIRLTVSDDNGYDMFAEQVKPQSRQNRKTISTGKGNNMSAKNSNRFDQNNTIYRNWRDLAVFYLFDKYKRTPGVRVREIEGKDNYYRSLDVEDNAKLLEEIIQSVEKDALNSYNRVHSYDDNGENIVLNIWIGGYTCNIGLKYDKAGKTGSVFVQTSNPGNI